MASSKAASASVWVERSFIRSTVKPRVSATWSSRWCARNRTEGSPSASAEDYEHGALGSGDATIGDRDAEIDARALGDLADRNPFVVGVPCLVHQSVVWGTGDRRRR